MSLGGFILFELMALGTVGVVIYTESSFQSFWDKGGWVFILLLLVIQACVGPMWRQRKEALKKIAEWKAAGLEVRKWDPARRHCYKEN